MQVSYAGTGGASIAGRSNRLRDQITPRSGPTSWRHRLAHPLKKLQCPPFHTSQVPHPHSIAYLHAYLVEEDHGGVALAEASAQLAHGTAHQAGLQGVCRGGEGRGGEGRGRGAREGGEGRGGGGEHEREGEWAG